MRRHSRKLYRSTSGTLNLTAMMDMFTIILVFLLKTFSVSYVELHPPREVSLPATTSKEKPKRYFAIDVSKKGIYIDKRLILPLERLTLPPESVDGDFILPLHAILQRKIDRGKLVFGTALIRSDREVPFDVIWKIMATTADLGFERFHHMGVDKG